MKQVQNTSNLETPTFTTAGPCEDEGFKEVLSFEVTKLTFETFIPKW
jgi:hypothetical protein